MLPYGQRSPDGLWWWDGVRWQPVPGAHPWSAQQGGISPQQRHIATAVLIVLAVLVIGLRVVSAISVSTRPVFHPMPPVLPPSPAAIATLPPPNGPPMAVNLTFGGGITGTMTSAVLNGNGKTCGPQAAQTYSVSEISGAAGGHRYNILVTISGYTGPGRYTADSGDLSISVYDGTTGADLFDIGSGTVTVSSDATSGTVAIDDLESSGTAQPATLNGTWSCPR